MKKTSVSPFPYIKECPFGVPGWNSLGNNKGHSSLPLLKQPRNHDGRLSIEEFGAQ